MSTQQDILERTYVIIQLEHLTKPRDLKPLRNHHDVDVIARVDTDGRYPCRVPTIALQDILGVGYVRDIEPYRPQQKISELVRRGIQLFLLKRSQQDNGTSVQDSKEPEIGAPSAALGAPSPTVPLLQQQAHEPQENHEDLSLTEPESINIVDPRTETNSVRSRPKGG